jgi:hypothetical protein
MATQRELDHQYRMAKWQSFTVLGKSLLRLLTIATIGGSVFFCIRELAGRETLADIRFQAIADLKANRWFSITASWILTFLSGGWAFGERLLRKKTIERTAAESSKLQGLIDPSRHSSRLTTRGETDPEDVI